MSNNVVIVKQHYTPNTIVLTLAYSTAKAITTNPLREAAFI